MGPRGDFCNELQQELPCAAFCSQSSTTNPFPWGRATTDPAGHHPPSSLLATAPQNSPLGQGSPNTQQNQRRSERVAAARCRSPAEPVAFRRGYKKRKKERKKKGEWVEIITSTVRPRVAAGRSPSGRGSHAAATPNASSLTPEGGIGAGGEALGAQIGTFLRGRKPRGGNKPRQS